MHVLALLFPCIQNDGVTEEEGWYLEQIKVTKTVQSTGRDKSWLFVCQNWLSLHEGDCQTRRHFFCQQSSNTGQKTRVHRLSYDIVCVILGLAILVRLVTGGRTDTRRPHIPRQHSVAR